MIQSNCQSTAKKIIEELGSRFVAESVGLGNYGRPICAIRTPFVYPDNTPIVIYVEQHGENVILTDRGDASDQAFLSGTGDGVVRSEIARIGARLNLTVQGDEMRFEASDRSLGEGVGQLLSAMQRVGGLRMTRKQRSRSSDFLAGVEDFITSRHMKFRRNYELKGATNTFKVDYAIETPQGYQQLYLFTFDPAPAKAESRMHDLFYWYTDWNNLMERDVSMREKAAPLKVVANTARQKMQSDRYANALGSLRLHFPELVIDRSDQDQLDELLAA